MTRLGGVQRDTAELSAYKNPTAPLILLLRKHSIQSGILYKKMCGLTVWGSSLQAVNANLLKYVSIYLAEKKQRIR